MNSVNLAKIIIVISEDTAKAVDFCNFLIFCCSHHLKVRYKIKVNKREGNKQKIDAKTEILPD